MSYPIIFRFDASTEIGLGHAYRCLALIEYLENICTLECIVVARELPEYLQKKLNDFNSQVFFLEGQDDLDFIRKLSFQYNSKAIVLDGYQFDQCYRKKLSEIGLKIICFDDINSLDNLHCHLVINALINAKNIGYQYSAPKAAHLLGLNYSIVRHDFLAASKVNFSQRTKLLINFGGSDTANLTLSLIHNLASFEINIQPENIIIITGGAYSSPDSIHHLCNEYGYTHLHNVNNMAEILTQCKMAICAPGSMVYELAYCGVPSIFLTIANNQLLSARAHQEMGWCEVIDGLQLDATKIALHRLNELWDKQEQLQQMYSLATTLVDGEGVRRIVDKIEKVIL